MSEFLTFLISGFTFNLHSAMKRNYDQLSHIIITCITVRLLIGHVTVCYLVSSFLSNVIVDKLLYALHFSS